MRERDRKRPFATIGNARLQAIAGINLTQAGPPDNLHMDEDIPIFLVTDQKAITLETIEPFHGYRFEIASRGLQGSVCPRALVWPRLRVIIAAFDVDGENFDGLTTPIAFCENALDARALGKRSPAMIPQYRKMDQDIARFVVGNQESISTGSSFQISLLYSAMVLSVEKKPRMEMAKWLGVLM